MLSLSFAQIIQRKILITLLSLQSTICTSVVWIWTKTLPFNMICCILT
jgi:hypothetical protein